MTTTTTTTTSSSSSSSSRTRKRLSSRNFLVAATLLVVLGWSSSSSHSVPTVDGFATGSSHAAARHHPLHPAELSRIPHGHHQRAQQRFASVPPPSSDDDNATQITSSDADINADINANINADADINADSDINADINANSDAAAATTPRIASLDDAITNRYACTRYQRHDGNYDGSRTPSTSDPHTVELAREALELACRAPTGFNVQPYKLLLVKSPAAKKALAKFCIGRNKDRVLDSDCSVVFLADREAMRSWTDYRSMLLNNNNNNAAKKKKSTLGWLKLRALVALFSSGLPLPKIVAGPVSFGLRLSMRIVSWITRSKLVVPTLSSPECWSQKNTMLVAMAYMLGCSARGLDTTPMEGYLSWGIRQSLGIPRRYTIPLVVSTGRAFANEASSKVGVEVEVEVESEADDAGIAHGNTKETATPRYPIDTVLYENGFP